MYNFQKQAVAIALEASQYGVALQLDRATKKLVFGTEYKGSKSVERAITRKMATYNKHVEQGF